VQQAEIVYCRRCCDLYSGLLEYTLAGRIAFENSLASLTYFCWYYRIKIAKDVTSLRRILFPVLCFFSQIVCTLSCTGKSFTVVLVFRLIWIYTWRGFQKPRDQSEWVTRINVWKHRLCRDNLPIFIHASSFQRKRSCNWHSLILVSFCSTHQNQWV